MEAGQAAHDAGMAVIVGAPNIVAGRSHIDNVSGSDLAAKGLVDVVCSDYIPASLLHALWALTRSPVGLDLPRAIAMGSKRPAELFGFTDRGEIAIGQRADLIRVRDRAGVPVVGGTWVLGRAVL
jgi:alpha-D-ribose 1-methylphosphonate 5-triphosphate diphosphatase